MTYNDAIMQKKEAALAFMQLLTSGRIDEAYDRYVDMKGRHHNAFYPSDLASLKQGMKDNEKSFPGKTWTPHHVFQEGDRVAVHSRIVLNPDLEIAALHVFRFEGDRIVEIWDVTQQVPHDSPNRAGMF